MPPFYPSTDHRAWPTGPGHTNGGGASPGRAAAAEPRGRTMPSPLPACQPAATAREQAVGPARRAAFFWPGSDVATRAPRRPAAAGQPLWPPPARVGRRWAAGLKRRNQAAAEPLGRQGGQGRSGLLISASRPASPGAPGLARADLTLPGSRSPGHPPYLFCPGLTRGLGWNGR